MASQWAAAVGVGVRPALLVAPATLFPQIAVKKLSAPHQYVKSKKITKKILLNKQLGTICDYTIIEV